MTSIKEKMNEQDQVLNNYSNVLADLSVRLGNNPPPSNNDLQEMSSTLNKTQAELSAILTWRAQVRTVTASVSQVLSNISSIISSAV